MPTPPNTEVDYHEYLTSPQWRWKAELAKQRVGNRCQICNRSTGEVALDAYHRTYERLGNELPDDITVLCRDCYQLYEKNKKLSRPPGGSAIPLKAYTLLPSPAVSVSSGDDSEPGGGFRGLFIVLGTVGALVGSILFLVMIQFPPTPPAPPTPLPTQTSSPTRSASAIGVLMDGSASTSTLTRGPPIAIPPPAAMPSSTPTPTPTPFPTRTLTPSSTPTLAPTRTPTRTSSPTSEPTPTQQGRHYYLSQDANIRRGPGTRYRVVRVAKAGEVMEVIGCNRPCAWYQLADGNWVREYLVVAVSGTPPAGNNPNAPAVTSTSTPSR